MGDGAFSNVYKAVERKSGRMVAVKVVRKYELNSSQVRNLFPFPLTTSCLYIHHVYASLCRLLRPGQAGSQVARACIHSSFCLCWPLARNSLSGHSTDGRPCSPITNTSTKSSRRRPGSLRLVRFFTFTHLPPLAVAGPRASGVYQIPHSRPSLPGSFLMPGDVLTVTAESLAHLSILSRLPTDLASEQIYSRKCKSCAVSTTQMLSS